MPQTGVRTNIFGIGEVYELQREGQWVEKNRESYREYGYFGGGNYKCIVQRIDYSNDTQTSSPRNSFLVRFSRVAAAGNSNYGWHGGKDLSGGSLIQRIDYSNDSNSLRNSLSISRLNLAATGNFNFGYFGGGSAPALISTVDRINYSNDLSTAIVRGPLSSARYAFGATGNSNFGYYGAGGQQSIVERISYSNDLSTAIRRGNLIFGRTYTYSCATGNLNFGYFSGGITGGFGYRSIVERVNYSNDTALASTRGPLSVGRAWTTGSGNSNFGYYAGGGTDIPNIYGSRIVDRIDYSNDTTIALIRGLLNTGTRDSTATSSHNFGGSPVSYLGAPWVATAPYGYFGGGDPNGGSTVDRVDYTNDTNTASARGLFSLSRNRLAATGNSNFGYFGGGSGVSIVDRLDYSNDSATVSVRGPLSSSRRYLSSTGNSNFGYFCAGYISSPYSTVDRIDYSNDSASASVRGSLSVARFTLAATGNSNFGYFDAGAPSVSKYERIDYSNDSVSTTFRGSILTVTNNKSATGTANFGYFVGGSGLSLIERIDYSNDTTTASSRGKLNTDRRAASATGSSSYGYVMGRRDSNPAFNVFSTVERIDYSNDTSIASVRGPLSSAKAYGAASSSQAFGGAPNTTTDPLPVYIRDATKFDDSNTLDLPFKRVLGSYGYFGGEGNATGTRIDRVDYSNDTATASVRSAISVARYILGATGNSNFGYFCGGRTPGAGPGKTTVDRIDYSNDSANVSIRTPLTSASYKTGFGNNNFGYIAHSQGGITIDRIDYSNDTNVVSKSVLYRPAYYRASTGNNNFGYLHEGFNTSVSPILVSSIVERIDYSNDSAKASIRGPLSLAKRSLAATGTQNFGYFGGGFVPGPVSTVDRIDYSNDTATASVRGPLSLARYNLAATGNSNFGYFGGGNPGPLSTVDRIDYSNDTQTASVRGPLSSARYYFSATTNARNS